MKDIVLLLIGFVLGYWLAKRKFKARPNSVLGEIAKAEPGLIEQQHKEKKENKQKILEILETQNPITNNHIEQLLGISDATATRYLEELEKEGHVRQVGKTGHQVYYERV